MFLHEIFKIVKQKNLICNLVQLTLTVFNVGSKQVVYFCSIQIDHIKVKIRCNPVICGFQPRVTLGTTIDIKVNYHYIITFSQF